MLFGAQVWAALAVETRLVIPPVYLESTLGNGGLGSLVDLPTRDVCSVGISLNTWGHQSKN